MPDPFYAPVPTVCPSGHVIPLGAPFCPTCGKAAASVPAGSGAVPGFEPARPPGNVNRRNWIIGGVASVVLIAAVGIILATSGSPSPTNTNSSNNPSQAQLTSSQRADDRCTVAVAAGVAAIQTGQMTQSELAGRLGSNSLLYAIIDRSNSYLNAALVRVHPRSAALQQTAREIHYLCSTPIVYLASAVSRGTISPSTAHADLRRYVVAIAALAVAIGGVGAAASYFSSVSGFSGVTGIEEVSGFTGLSGVSGFSAPSGTSDNSPGGFTGVTGSSGLSGVTGGGISGFSGSGGVAGTS